jgi:hypothetical protein
LPERGVKHSAVQLGVGIWDEGESPSASLPIREPRERSK